MRNIWIPGSRGITWIRILLWSWYMGVWNSTVWASNRILTIFRWSKWRSSKDIAKYSWWVIKAPRYNSKWSYIFSNSFSYWIWSIKTTINWLNNKSLIFQRDKLGKTKNYKHCRSIWFWSPAARSLKQLLIFTFKPIK